MDHSFHARSTYMMARSNMHEGFKYGKSPTQEVLNYHEVIYPDILQWGARLWIMVTRGFLCIDSVFRIGNVLSHPPLYPSIISIRS